MMHMCLQYICVQMKGKRALGKPERVLEGESQKLKDKLEQLKEQIKLKKAEKEMNRTSQSIGSNSLKESSHARMNSTQYSKREDQQLADVLAELKIQNFVGKLREKEIVRLDQLMNLSEQEIDKWKDIPVGFRIKIKKYIEKSKSKSKGGELKVTQTSNEKDIETIIKSRKAEKIYVPLQRKSEEPEEEGYNGKPELEEEEQEKMMLSLMQILGGKERSSSFKKKGRNQSRKVHVHWSADVDQMEKKHTKVTVYPKQIIKKSLFHQQIPISSESIPEDSIQTPKSTSKVIIVNTLSSQSKEYPDYKYCWSCLKKLPKTVEYLSNNHQFCSISCQDKYDETVDSSLIEQIVQTEQKYNHYLQTKMKELPLSDEQDLLILCKTNSS